MAGSVEGLLEGGQGCNESIPGTVRSSAGLRHSLLGKCAHSLWEGCVETEMAEVIGRLAVSGAGLIGGSFGLWVTVMDTGSSI